MAGPQAARDRIRRRVIFRGHVQGVGFRYTTARIARRSPVTGYVMNRADGSVELVIDADRNVADQFVDEIKLQFGHNIHDVAVGELESDEQFDRFEIRYHRR